MVSVNEMTAWVLAVVEDAQHVDHLRACDVAKVDQMACGLPGTGYVRCRHAFTNLRSCAYAQLWQPLLQVRDGQLDQCVVTQRLAFSEVIDRPDQDVVKIALRLA